MKLMNSAPTVCAIAQSPPQRLQYTVSKAAPYDIQEVADTFASH
jgi:hypothetical protein